MFDVEDVLPIRPDRAGETTNGTAHNQAIQRQRWYSLLDRLEERALVFLGSQRTCHACEHVFCAMFHETLYQPSWGELPFKFGWTHDLYSELPSAFATEIHGMDRSHAPRHDAGIVGMQLGGKFHEISDRSRVWSTYGVSVAQRRKSGQLWLVLAGDNRVVTSSRVIMKATAWHRSGTKPAPPVGRPTP